MGALLRITPRRALAAAGAVLVVLLAAALLLVRRVAPPVQDGEALHALLSRLSSRDPSVVVQAAAGLPGQAALLSRPDRLGEAAALFSGDRLRALAGEASLKAARSFWRGMVLLGKPAALRLIPPELARLRHALLLARAGMERPEDLEPLAGGEGGPRVRAAMDELLAELFKSPAPPREEMGALLWDRVNLEEMAGLTSEAIASYRLLTYERVHDHWEVESRAAYHLAKAELLGRLRRRVSPRDGQLAAGLDPASDPELVAFRSEEGGAMAHLLDGLDLFERGQALPAIAALKRYLGPEGEDGAPALASRPRQLAGLLRALARLDAAREAFRTAEALGFVPIGGGGTRAALELRRAALLAGLSLREEFGSVAAELGRGDRETALLLEALAQAAWGDRERGAAELRERIAALGNGAAAGLEELASGAAPPLPRGLFELGQLSNELGDLPRLERFLGRLEFAIESESDEGYLDFLRALVRLRRGQVVEAWADLERLLDRPTFPPGLSRREVGRFMEGAQESADLLARARALLADAEKDLDSLRVKRHEIDPVLALRASTGLWIARAEGEAIDPLRLGPRRESAAQLLLMLRVELEAIDQPSYSMDRAWIDLRNALASSFRSLSRTGKLDQALARLSELDALLGKAGEGALTREKAELHRERAARREAVDEDGAREDNRRAGQLFLELAGRESLEKREGDLVPGEVSRGRAARAFERAGDLEGVIRAIAPIANITRDQDLLVRYGRAFLGRGDLRKAREVLLRVLMLGEEFERVVEEPGDAVFMGGYHFRDPSADLVSWLELYPFVDPLNGLGTGRLRYDAVRRTLEWRAPHESKFGTPVFLAAGETVRLPSGDDPRKMVLASPRRDPRGAQFPLLSGQWDLKVAYREVPVDPVQLEARLALGEATFRLARLPSFENGGQTLAFCERHLSGGGSPRVRSAVVAVVERALADLYADPGTAAGLRRELDRILGVFLAELGEEENRLGAGTEARREWLREVARSVEEFKGATADPARVRELLRRDLPQIHDRLRGFYLSAVRLLLSREGRGGPTEGVLSQLLRELFDAEAREELLFLCEQLGNRSPIWRRAMFLRALQLERQADEAARAVADPAVLGPAPRPADLVSAARDIYERLLLASTLADGPTWIGRALLSLGRMEARRGRLAEARHWLDRLADADLEALGRELAPEAKTELSDLARTAAFTRADLARRAGDLPGAVTGYAEAIQRHGGSPLVLWGHLQLGSCYEAQGLPEEAYREYQKGKQLLAGQLGQPAALAHWLGGDRSKLTERLKDLFPEREASAVLAALGPAPAGSADREFWERIFEAKLSGIARRP